MGHPLCIVPGCGRRHGAFGYCQAHYIRVREHGHPDVETPIRCKVRQRIVPSDPLALWHINAMAVRLAQIPVAGRRWKAPTQSQVEA